MILLQWMQKLSPVLLQSEFMDNPDQSCRLIVEMATPQMHRVTPYIQENAGTVYHQFRMFSIMALEIPYSAIEIMAMSPHIKRIWYDIKVKALLDHAVPTVGGNKVQELGYSGKDVSVAVIDTGIYPHPDLIYPQSRITGWHDIVNERAYPYDDNGHGTHVSGIIAGNGVSSRGRYRGMAPEANLIGIKVLDSEGLGNTSDVIAALEWCIENQDAYKIKVINLSLGATAQDSYRNDPLCRAVAAAWESGMVVCVAAGNDGPDLRTINTPGIAPSAITVGNLDDKESDDLNDDVINDSSSRGPTVDNLMKPDILAPGTNIMSLRNGPGYRSLSGTSMATPMVTGAAAQILQKWPSYKPDQVKSVLKQNARSLNFQPVAGGPGVLEVDTMFEESKKSTNNIKSFLTSIFGKDSALMKALKPQPAQLVDKVAITESPQKELVKRFEILPLIALAALLFI